MHHRSFSGRVPAGVNPSFAERVLAGVVAAVLALLAGCTSHKSEPSPSPKPTSTAAVSSAATTPTPTESISTTAPLTGLPLTDATNAALPALAVKVDNVAGAWPQAGLNEADIVFDIPVEGGLTRLLALFHSHHPHLVGPIRSARPVDADILHLFGHAIFAFSGGTASDLAPIKDHSNATPIWWDVTPAYFIVRKDHAVPHQVFADTATLYAEGRRRTPAGPPPPIFHYSPTPTSGGIPATTITARFPAASALWTWDGRQYLRTQDGRADMLLDGTQVGTENVVILSVAVRGTSARDSHGSVVPLPVVIGSGKAWVARDGVVVQGTWSRPTLSAPMTLRTAGGEDITLTPGRTWVEILPNTSQPQIH